jgi:hypothetical protein
VKKNSRLCCKHANYSIDKVPVLVTVILESPRCTLTPHRGDEESGSWEEDDVTIATVREKQIKGMLRNKKIELTKTLNPEWKDLSEDWYDPDLEE